MDVQCGAKTTVIYSPLFPFFMELEFRINEDYLVAHALSEMIELREEEPVRKWPAHMRAIWALAKPVISTARFSALRYGLKGVSMNFTDASFYASSMDYHVFISWFDPTVLVTHPFLGVSDIVAYAGMRRDDFLTWLKGTDDYKEEVLIDPSLERRLEAFIGKRIDALSEAQSLMKAIQDTQHYRMLLEETRRHMDKTRMEWEATYDDALSFMRNVTGLSFDNTYTVYVVSPFFGSGGRYIEQRIIECPATEDDARFKRGKLNLSNAIGLWHEVLHDDDYLGGEDIAHAIIELAADNALRVHLTESDYIPLSGHERLNTLRQRIYDSDWGAYVASPNPKDIRAFAAEMQEKFGHSTAQPQ